MISKKQSDLWPAIFLMGPTATGKTDLAIHLAQRLPIEIISVDSAMVYQDMSIGTAKPSSEVLAAYPHHLVDIITPLEAYSTATFYQNAIKLIKQIQNKGKLPLLVGGTMLYFNSLEKGLSELPAADTNTRDILLQKAETIGWQGLHQELQLIDPIAGQRIHPNDPQRIQRALEVYYLTGKTMTEWYQESQNHQLDFPYIKIALLPQDRAILHERLSLRLKNMLAQGFIEEVAYLKENYLGLSLKLPAMRCVGYRQIWEYLENNLDKSILFDKILYATRQFAKRQFTWLRSIDYDYDFDPFTIHQNQILQQIEQLLFAKAYNK